MTTVTATPPETEADAAAEERARAETAARLRRGRTVTAVVVGALVVVVGVVALLGGFGRRTDLLTPVAAGSLISTGPYEVTLEHATVQHRTSDDQWEVVVTGTARTTGSTSIAPDTGDDGFVFARDAAGGEVQSVDSVALGDTDAISKPDNLTPGLLPVPWSLKFEFARQPSGSLFVAVFDQEYTTPYLFSDEMGWRATRKASTFTLPLEKLADTEY